ncbi:MAG: transglutaminase domain-containing protein [Mycobacteriales bacterium]
MTGWLDQPLLDLAAVDLDGSGPVRYLLHQRFRYDYDRPAYELHQRLVAVPRDRHGPLRRQAHLVSVSTPGRPASSRGSARADREGNLVVRVRLPVVEDSVEFTTAAVVERAGPPADALLPAAALADARHLRPTRLTRPDAALRALAAELRAEAPDDRDFALAACARLRSELDFAFEATSVSTTAAEAYATRQGVCQDFAHVMLAVCRAAGVPARYVSGHLLGQEGGSHAWVEVLVADGGRARAVAVDPANGCRVGARHLPVAVGRDYADVAPTSGVYSGTARGRLTWTKRAGVVALSPAGAAPRLRPSGDGPGPRHRTANVSR